MLKFILFLTLFVSAAQAQDMEAITEQAASCRQYIAERHPDWPMPVWQCREVTATTLSQALAYQQEFLGADNVGYTMGADNPACAALRSAGLTKCNLNTRVVLVQFLSLYGEDLFPWEGTDWPWPGDTAYSGKAEENRELVRQINRNAALFADGELTAEEVQRWR